MIDYRSHLEDLIRYFTYLQSYELNIRQIDPTFEIISGKIIFDDKSVLEFIEVVDYYENFFRKEKYKYHYMDKDNRLIFRYDNAEHHKELSSFPHHKHISEKVIACNEQDMEDILSEIKSLLS